MVQQPQGPHLSRPGGRLLPALLALAACRDAPPAAAPEPPRLLYRLAGRVTPDRSPFPDALPFAGGEALVARCGETRPCAAERWAPVASPEGSATGEALVLLRAGDRVTGAAGEPDWPATWKRLRGTLAACLPDPLAVPPAGDPAATRLLRRDGEAWSWLVDLSGDNPCALGGRLVLDAAGPEVHLDALTAEGRPWRAGGREAAAARLRARRRAWIEAHWPQLDARARAEARVELARDPEGAALLERLPEP